MYIKSELKENGRILVDVDLSDDYQITGDVTRLTHKIEHDFLVGSCSVFYTHGFCIINSKYDVLTTNIDQITVESDYIQISLLATGSSRIIKKDKRPIKDIPQGVLQLAFRKKINTQVLLPEDGDEPMNYFRIFLSRSFYLSLLSDENWSNHDIFHNEVLKGNYISFGQIVLPASFKLVEILGELLDHNLRGSLAQYFIRTKLKELFLMMHIHRTAENVPPALLASDNLVKAKTFLDNHYSNPPTIKQLAKIVSLNELKLKQGFKETYGTSIRAYVIELRMQKARKMFNSDYSVGEVAESLGYKNVSHFIASYKKRYGTTPKQHLSN